MESKRNLTFSSKNNKKKKKKKKEKKRINNIYDNQNCNFDSRRKAKPFVQLCEYLSNTRIISSFITGFVRTSSILTSAQALLV